VLNARGSDREDLNVRTDAALDVVTDARLARGYGGRFYGVYPAMVTDIVDPAGQGRVRVKLPWSPDVGGDDYEAWARLATLMAGTARGSWFVPDVDDEVLVVFEAGDVRHPYVVGGLWNGRDAPPEGMDSAGENNKKTLKSRNGVTITLDDSSGSERLTLETPGGQRMVLKDGPGAVEIEDSNGNSIKLETSGVTVNASAKVTVSASVVEVSAGSVTVNAGLSRFSGVVQADTVISNSVISASYTPGAGNIW
jgi:uncharacterized protein involved in type VI secretion and phage assembly